METDPAFLSELAFTLRKLAALLILPPLGPLLVVALGLALGRRRAGRALAAVGLVLAVLFSSPLSVGWMLRPLESAPPLALDALPEADAIVILAGGKRSFAPEFGGETLNRFSLERARYGAKLARRSGLPVLVTGGRLYGRESEAELLRDALETEWKVPVRWVEDAARDTRGNARHSAAMLLPEARRRVLLVTHAVHMPRAQREFEAAGLEVVPAPTAWFASRPDENGGGRARLLPTPGSAYAGWLAAHEWLGRVAYAITR